MSAVVDIASPRAPVAPDTPPVADRIVRMPEAIARSGLSIATIYRRCRAGQFAPKIPLGGTSVGFRESELARWIAERGQAGTP